MMKFPFLIRKFGRRCLFIVSFDYSCFFLYCSFHIVLMCTHLKSCWSWIVRNYIMILKLWRISSTLCFFIFCFILPIFQTKFYVKQWFPLFVSRCHTNHSEMFRNEKKWYERWHKRERRKNKTDKPESARLKAGVGLNDMNSSIIKSNEKHIIYMTIRRSSKSVIRKFNAFTLRKKSEKEERKTHGKRGGKSERDENFWTKAKWIMCN